MIIGVIKTLPPYYFRVFNNNCVTKFDTVLPSASAFSFKSTASSFGMEMLIVFVFFIFSNSFHIENISFKLLTVNNINNSLQ